MHAFLDNVDDLAKEIGSINTALVEATHSLGTIQTPMVLKLHWTRHEQLAKQGKTVCKAVCYGYGVCSVVVACLKSMGIEYITGRSLRQPQSEPQIGSMSTTAKNMASATCLSTPPSDRRTIEKCSKFPSYPRRLLTGI